MCHYLGLRLLEGIRAWSSEDWLPIGPRHLVTLESGRDSSVVLA